MLGIKPLVRPVPDVFGIGFFLFQEWTGSGPDVGDSPHGTDVAYHPECVSTVRIVFGKIFGLDETPVMRIDYQREEKSMGNG